MDRRRFTQTALLLPIAGSLLGVSACARQRPALRFGKHPWPGYAFVAVAADLGELDASKVNVVQTPSASASLRALESGTLDAAGLTLDEVLSAREEGLALSVVTIVDVSAGADVVLSRDKLESLADLRGKRIGVEKSAVGAIMLDALLRSADLTLADIVTVNASIDEHETQLAQNRMDAVITYEPVSSRLLQSGMTQIFSSAQIPGTIVDVIAVRTPVLKDNPEAVAALVRGYFAGLEAWQNTPQRAAASLSRELALAEEQLEAAYAGLLLPSLVENRKWLQGSSPRLAESALKLGEVMKGAQLLSRTPTLEGLVEGDFLPVGDA